MENKKSNSGLIIAIIIIILLLLFALWFFVLRDKGNNNDVREQNNTNVNGDVTPSNNTVEYDYRDGVLTQIVDENGNPKQTDFVIDGIILIGNRHSYNGRDDEVEIIKDFVNQGYKKEGLNSSFYLNEWIELYIDTNYSGSESDVRILIVPHKDINEYEKMEYTALEELASEKGTIINYNNPDPDNYKYVGNGYVNQDYLEGKYDILFTYKGKIAYFINISEVKEPTE